MSPVDLPQDLLARSRAGTCRRFSAIACGFGRAGSRGILVSVLLFFSLRTVKPAFPLDPQRSPAQYALRIWGKREGLPGSWVNAILPTKAGYLWLATPDGLLRFDGVRFSVYNHQSSSGLPTDDILSLCEGRNGRLWYPTIAGVAVVDPRRVPMNTRTPPVWIEEVVADGRRLAPGGGLELPAGTRHLEIRCTAPSFSAPERIRFEHRLEGLDSGFFPAGGERVARYTSLGPGRYQFVVRSSNEDGVWGKESAVLVFSVRRYVWQSYWFYGLCTAVLLVASILAFELRVRSLRHKEQELKRRVEEEMASVRVLRGLLPICSWCKKVREDAGYWKQIALSPHPDLLFVP